MSDTSGADREANTPAGVKKVKGSRVQTRTGRWVPAFLEALKRTMNVRVACEQAGVGYSTVYRRKARHKKFSRAWDRAVDQAVDALELQAYKLAMGSKGDPDKGVEPEPASERMIIFLLTKRRPKVYGDTTRLEHTGANGGPIENVTWSEEERRAALAAIHARVGASPGAADSDGETAAVRPLLLGPGADLDGSEGDAGPLAESCAGFESS